MGTMPATHFGSHEVCIICLSEDGLISSRNAHLGCKCKVPVHSECWWKYIQSKKGSMECPICHVITLGNPILSASITGMPKNVMIRPSISSDEQNNTTGKCICGCLATWIATAIVAAILG
jgi:hypothetical protein